MKGAERLNYSMEDSELFHDCDLGPDVCDIDIKRRILQRRPKPQFTVRYFEIGTDRYRIHSGKT
jgi:hypothetical protein